MWGFWLRLKWHCICQAMVAILILEWFAGACSVWTRARILPFLVIHQFWWHVYYSYSFNLLFSYFSTWFIWALIILLSLFFGGRVGYLLCFTTHFVPQSTGFIRSWTALTVKPINSICQRLIIVTVKWQSCTIPVKWGLQSSLNHRM